MMERETDGEGKAQVQPLSEEESARKAKLRCMKLLEYSDRTEAQLRRKLAEDGFPSFAVDAAIAYVKKFHYLDDRRFVENYVLQNGDRKSARRISQELMQKGIAASYIEEALEGCSTREEEAGKKLLEKHARGKDLTQEKIRWSMVRYLTGKGFSYDLARHLVQDYIRTSAEEITG